MQVIIRSSPNIRGPIEGKKMVGCKRERARNVETTARTEIPIKQLNKLARKLPWPC